MDSLPKDQSIVNRAALAVGTKINMNLDGHPIVSLSSAQQDIFGATTHVQIIQLHPGSLLTMSKITD